MSNCYGYGIAITDEITPKSTKHLLELLSMAPEYGKDALQALREYASCTLKEGQTLHDLPVSGCLEILTNEDWRGISSVAVILADVIQEVEQIELSAVQNTYTGETFLVFEPRLPWTLKKNERDMTEITMQDLVMKYLSIISDAAPVFKECEWVE